MERAARTTLALVLPALLLIGCSTAEPEPEAPVEEPAPVADPVDVGMGDGDPVDLVPPPEPGQRDRRRMDIDQLDAAIKAATGGLFWRVGDTNQFEALSATLGKPDFINSTTEDLSASLLFQKFLGDAANSVCTELADVDPIRAEDARTLFVHAGVADTLDSHPEGVEANLSQLLLRYHGRTVDPGSEQLNAWRWLFESSVHVSNDPVAAWRAVCVGLITHPDFYTY